MKSADRLVLDRTEIPAVGLQIGNICTVAPPETEQQCDSPCPVWANSGHSLAKAWGEVAAVDINLA